MNRRESIRTLMAATSTLVALPAWAHGWSKGDFLTSSSIFTPAEQSLLASVIFAIRRRMAGTRAIVIFPGSETYSKGIQIL